jgi:mono/diheme cytochrome c family protein
MAGEQIGKISNKLRMLFAVCSVIFLLVLAISPVRDQFREWKHYKRSYVRFAKSRPESRSLLADYHPGINQIWLPQLNVTDRCTTCHQGIDQAGLSDESTPEPFRAHPTIPHQPTDWGCVVCHQGQGLATEVEEAHKATPAWEMPLVPLSYIQGTCGVCHRQSVPETPKLASGRNVMDDLNCVGCHKLQGVERPVMVGPDLTHVGNKTGRNWIFKWLRDPRTLTDANGNVSVNGYESEEEPRMPHFRLNEQELKALSIFLGAQKAGTIELYRFNPLARVAWDKQPDIADQGEARFRQMFCSTCHSLAVVRGGESQMIGGDIGPELSKVGSKVGKDWLAYWLRNPQAYLPHALMPRYGWSDEDLYKVTRYIMDRLNDPDLLKDVPELPESQTADIQLGTRLFQEKGCSSCHLIAGIKTPLDFGLDLSAEGAKNVSQLDFGDAKIPRNLISFLEAKISDPVSVNSNARMPLYHFKEGDQQALTTAVLSMKGEQSMPGIGSLVLPVSKSEYHPAGDFGKAYERYKCYVCHRFFGYGSTLAPDLSYEGSRAQRRWIADFLKNPQTLRPTLIFRMPQFNMTDQEADICAEYISLVLQAGHVDLSAAKPEQFTPEQASEGKQLYELKYQCQSCHTVGAAGGYVGPNLINAGNWLNIAWIQGWLQDPQALVPGTIEPHREFSSDEIQALAAYLMNLKQSGKTKLVAASGGLE